MYHMFLSRLLTKFSLITLCLHRVSNKKKDKCLSSVLLSPPFSQKCRTTWQTRPTNTVIWMWWKILHTKGSLTVVLTSRCLSSWFGEWKLHRRLLVTLLQRNEEEYETGGKYEKILCNARMIFSEVGGKMAPKLERNGDERNKERNARPWRNVNLFSSGKNFSVE